jgi:hypothetical protein
MRRPLAGLIAALMVLAVFALARAPSSTLVRAGTVLRTQAPQSSSVPVAHFPLIEKAAPTPTPLPTQPPPTGVCADEAPFPSEGAQAWVTPLDIPAGKAGTLCVRLIQSDQVVAGASVSAVLIYPSSTKRLGPKATGLDGVAALAFTVPASTSSGAVVDVEATATYQGQDYTAVTCFNVVGNKPAIVVCA